MRVEQDARRDVSREVDQLLRLLRAVGVIAGDGIADVLEVNANLVGASGVNLGFHQRGIEQAFRYAEAGMGVASVAFAHGHAFAM